MEECKLVGKIVRVEGECSAGHRVGEEFDLTLYSEEANRSLRAPNICSFFYNAIFPIPCCLAIWRSASVGRR